MNILKFIYKKGDILDLKKIRKPLFDINFYWGISLFFVALIILITGAIGLNLFFYVYKEEYKTLNTSPNFSELINTKRLESLIEKRNSFINRETNIPSDPSL